MRRERLPRLLPGDLDPKQARLYAAITDGPRKGGAFALVDQDGSLTGPFGVMLHAPRVGTALQELGAALRFGTALSPRVRELAILVVAAHWDSEFERQAHEATGRTVGISEDELAELRAGRRLELADPTEQATHDVVRALVTEQDLDDLTYDAAREALGVTALVELSALVGYYATLALQLRVFRIASPRVLGA